MALEAPPVTPSNDGKAGGRCPVQVQHHALEDGGIPAPGPMISNIESFIVSTVPLVPELPEVSRRTHPTPEPLTHTRSRGARHHRTCHPHVW